MYSCYDDPMAKYQLVLHFPENAFPSFDAMVNLEDTLIDMLHPDHLVDGHDIGSGTINIFIITKDPKRAFASASKILHSRKLLPVLRAAYRDVDEEVFHVLWPEGDTKPFEVI